MFFFQHGLADVVVGMDDLAFIDGLWADWSPGYDGSEDIPHVKDCLRDPANLAAALGYYRATLGGVGVDPALDAVQNAGSEVTRAAHAVPARPHRRLHGGRGGRGGERASSPRRARGSRWSTAPGTSCTSSVRTSSTRSSSTSSRGRTAAQGSRKMVPSRTASPSRTSEAATRSARAGSSGHPRHGGNVALGDTSSSQRFDEPAPSLAIAALEARSARWTRPPSRRQDRAPASRRQPTGSGRAPGRRRSAGPDACRRPRRGRASPGSRPRRRRRAGRDRRPAAPRRR